MPSFLYSGTDEKDKIVSGIITAANNELAAQKLEKMSIHDCDLYETMTEPKANVSFRDLSVFAMQMATIYRTNISLLEGLLLIKDQIENKQLKIAILEVHKLIHEGYTLGDAMKMYPHIFTDYFIKSVGVAEISGTLEHTFKELHGFYKNRDAISKKIKNMLLYPTMLTLFLMVIVSFVILKVIPIFNDLLVTYGIDMPRFTQVVVNVVVWLSNNFIITTATIVIIIIGLVTYFRSEKGKVVFNKILFKSKIFRKIEIKILAINYSKSVATLLKSGMILSNAIELSNTIVEGTLFDEKFEKVKEDIVKGEDFYYTIQEFGIYSLFYAKMLSIGNDSGSLDKAFFEVAEMLESELEEDIERLQKILEPILMLFIGGIVAVVLVSVAMPMINILDQII